MDSLEQAGSVEIAVRKFDPMKMKPDATVLLIGKRGTGKSTLLVDLMYHMHKKLYAGIAMAPTQDSVDMFETFLPPALVYTDFEADAVDKLMKTKRALSRLNKSHARKRSSRTPEKRHIAIILDDCMYDKKTLSHKAIRDVFMNGRHEDVFFVNLQQYVMDMSPGLRNQIDYIFIMRDMNPENRMKLWRNFFGVVSDFQQFNVLMDNCTENFECLVACNRIQSNNWQDCVFWYKACPTPPTFRLGHPTMWYLSYKFGILPSDNDAENKQSILEEVRNTFFVEPPTGAQTQTASHGSYANAVSNAEASAIKKAREQAYQKELDKLAQQQAKHAIKKKTVHKLGYTWNKDAEPAPNDSDKQDDNIACRKQADTGHVLAPFQKSKTPSRHVLQSSLSIHSGFPFRKSTQHVTQVGRHVY